MWAVGCIMGELFDAKPMFAGENEIDQLFLIMKSLGGLTHTQEQCLHKYFKGVKFPPIKIKQPLDLKYIGKVNKNELSFMK
jgi:cyclin-dependent kinase-like